MNVKLSDDVFESIPLHDAVVFGFVFRQAEDGYLVASVIIEISPDESLSALRRIGLSSRKMSLFFKDCWRITSDFLGVMSSPETLSKCEIVKESDLVNELVVHGFLRGQMPKHYRLTFSGGSKLNFVSGEILAVDQSTT